jgi:hypothetical protein
LIKTFLLFIGRLPNNNNHKQGKSRTTMGKQRRAIYQGKNENIT